jgi:hypothetical protein
MSMMTKKVLKPWVQITESTEGPTASAAAINRKNAKGLSKKNKHLADPILVNFN